MKGRESLFDALRHTAEAQFHSAGDTHGVSVKPSQLLALLDEVDENRRVIALCAADTTAADLAQEVEFRNAALMLIADLAQDEPGGLNFAARAETIARDALRREQPC